MYVSIEKKNPLKRDQALSDATNGQMGKNLEPYLYLYLYLYHHWLMPIRQKSIIFVWVLSRDK
jgi:hypothetical protein